MMKRIILTCIILLGALSCGQQQNRLQNGDLIFVGLPLGYDAETGSMDEAISSATGEDGALNLIHVAIAEVQADSIWIIDATIAHGVDRHPLDTFLKDFTLKDGSYPEFIVKRVQGADASAAVEMAKPSAAAPTTSISSRTTKSSTARNWCRKAIWMPMECPFSKASP